MNVKPLLFLLLLFCAIPLACGGSVTGTNFFLFIENGGSVGFQNQEAHFVLLTVDSGELNSSVTTLTMQEDSGKLVFYSNKSLTLTVSYSVSKVEVAGDNGQSNREIENNTQISIASTNTVTIEWWITINPWRFALPNIYAALALASIIPIVLVAGLVVILARGKVVDVEAFLVDVKGLLYISLLLVVGGVVALYIANLFL